MKRTHLAIPFFLFVLVGIAHADSFDITQLTFTVGPFNAMIPGAMSFSLTGPGTHISGVGNFVCQSAWCSFPATSVPPGSILTSIGQIGNDGTFQSTVGGTTLVANSIFLFDLSLNVLGSIDLPANPTGSTLNACVPASVPNLNFVSGQTPSDTFVQFNLNTPTKGTFCTAWSFSNGQYTFMQGTFTASAVPEPGTLALVGPGLFGLIAARVRRRSARRTDCRSLGV